MREYGELVKSLAASGHHLAGAQLRSIPAATTVRGRDGKPAVTDGPFAETKEQFGGYLLIECENLDEAIFIAKRTDHRFRRRRGGAPTRTQPRAVTRFNRENILSTAWPGPKTTLVVRPTNGATPLPKVASS